MLQISLLGDQRFTLDGSTARGSLAAARSRSSPTWPCTPASRSRGRQLAAALWPDSTDAQALTNLRRELHHLRAVLGDDAEHRRGRAHRLLAADADRTSATSPTSSRRWPQRAPGRA